MEVRVNDRRVSMRMCVRLGVADRRVTWLVLMLVMDVVYVRVTVLEGLMLVLVLVALRDVKPRPHRHQRCPTAKATARPQRAARQALYVVASAPALPARVSRGHRWPPLDMTR